MIWAFTTSIVIGLIILALFQAASTLSIMNGIIVRQSLAPDELQSRVNTTARLIAWSGSPLGTVLGGVLTEYFGVTLAIVVCTAGTAGTAVGLGIALASRLWRVPTLATLRTSAA